jgi:hypothetical protein
VAQGKFIAQDVRRREQILVISACELHLKGKLAVETDAAGRELYRKRTAEDFGARA